MLSPRILHYTKDQIFWQCLSLTACESAPQGLPGSVNQISRIELNWRSAFHNGRMEGNTTLSRYEKGDLQLDESWKAAVRSYSGCKLTRSEDKLMALAGIANVMRKASGQRYLAGLWGPTAPSELWTSNIIDQLGWKVLNGSKSDGSPSVRYDKWCAPTWSWASVNGEIILANRLRKDRHYTAEVVFASTQPDLQSVETGRVLAEHSMMILKGILVDLSFERSPNHARRLDWQPAMASAKPVWCHTWLDEGMMLQKSERQRFDFPVMLLACTRNHPPMTPEGISGHGIVLEPYSTGVNHFARIGMIEFLGLSDQAWQMLSVGRDLALHKTPQSGKEGPKSDTVITLV